MAAPGRCERRQRCGARSTTIKRTRLGCNQGRQRTAAEEAAASADAQNHVDADHGRRAREEAHLRGVQQIAKLCAQPREAHGRLQGDPKQEEGMLKGMANRWTP